MHVIAKKALAEFWGRRREAKGPLAAWYKLMRGVDCAELTSLRRTFGSADYVAPHTVFDVGGNKYRIVTAIHYNRGKVYIRHVFTHAEYDRWSAARRRTKR